MGNGEDDRRKSVASSERVVAGTASGCWPRCGTALAGVERPGGGVPPLDDLELMRRPFSAGAVFLSGAEPRRSPYARTLDTADQESDQERFDPPGRPLRARPPRPTGHTRRFVPNKSSRTDRLSTRDKGTERRLFAIRVAGSRELDARSREHDVTDEDFSLFLIIYSQMRLGGPNEGVHRVCGQVRLVLPLDR